MFLFAFIFIIIVTKYAGITDRPSGSSTGPLSWKETLFYIPLTAIISLIISLFYLYVQWYKGKDNNN